MPRVNVKLTQFDLDKGRYSKTLDEAIKQQMRMAARAFLNVAMRAIPVRTGFARGSLRNLAEAAGLGGAGGPSIDVETPAGAFLRTMQILRNTSFRESELGRRSGMYNISRRSLTQAGAQMPIEYYRDGKRRIVKTPQSGREFATQAGHIFQSDSFVYTFNFESLISYLNINDMFTNPRNKGTPWNAFKFGRVTFLNYLKSVALTKLPSVQAFITESYVSVSGSTVNRTAFAIVNRDTRFRI
jgi:hypothetical protein